MAFLLPSVVGRGGGECYPFHKDEYLVHELHKPLN